MTMPVTPPVPLTASSRMPATLAPSTSTSFGHFKRSRSPLSFLLPEGEGAREAGGRGRTGGGESGQTATVGSPAPAPFGGTLSLRERVVQARIASASANPAAKPSVALLPCRAGKLRSKLAAKFPCAVCHG